MNGPDSEPRFTYADLQLAFHDGVTAGIASQDGTFGEEDFMGGPAAEKAEKFIEEEGGWESLWRYCGGVTSQDGLPRYMEMPTELSAALDCEIGAYIGRLGGGGLPTAKSAALREAAYAAAQSWVNSHIEMIRNPAPYPGWCAESCGNLARNSVSEAARRLTEEEAK